MASRRFTRLKDRLAAFDSNRVRNALASIDIDFVKAGAERITETDVRSVVRRMDTLRQRLASDGPLARFVEDGRLLLNLVRDAWEGTYRSVPYWTISAAAFTLLYVLNPMDAVPDALPAVGLLDDATVLSLCLMLLEQDLDAYRTWREETGAAREALPSAE